MAWTDGLLYPVLHRLPNGSATSRGCEGGREMTRAFQEQFREARSLGARWAGSERGGRLQKHGSGALQEDV